MFNESVAYRGELQGSGRIEDFEVVLPAPHGGELGGFALLRGSADQIASLQGEDDFDLQVTRADLIVENQVIRDSIVGVVPGNEAAQRLYEERGFNPRWLLLARTRHAPE